MIKQSFETGHHEWEKQNNVTRKYGKKLYDIYRCKHCGIEGKSYQIGTISIQNKFYKKAPCCLGIQQKKPTKLKVLCCTAFSPEFDNIIKGCIFDILPPPPGEDNKLGEWMENLNISKSIVSNPINLRINENTTHFRNQRS